MEKSSFCKKYVCTLIDKADKHEDIKDPGKNWMWKVFKKLNLFKSMISLWTHLSHLMENAWAKQYKRGQRNIEL